MQISKGVRLLSNYLKEAANGQAGSFVGPSPTRNSLPPAIVNSFPKCGTHLLGKLLTLLGYSELPVMLLQDNYLDFRTEGDWHEWQPIRESNLTNIQNPRRISQLSAVSLLRLRGGQSVTCHIQDTSLHRKILCARKIRHLFIIRDLRDVIVSQMRYRMSLRTHGYLPNWYYFLNALGSDQERLEVVMNGRDRFLEAYTRHLECGWGWVEKEEVCVIRYEDLIGPAGGGAEDAQVAAIQAVADHLGILISDQEIKSTAGSLWGGKTRTMNQGNSQYWRELYDDKLKLLFEKKYGEFQKQLGYPDNWD